MSECASCFFDLDLVILWIMSAILDQRERDGEKQKPRPAYRRTEPNRLRIKGPARV